VAINIRVKGASGEREIADALNYRASLVHARLGLPFSWADDGAQRNQLQTAIGGCDLTKTWGYAVEIKRQEMLNINGWWAQCVASAIDAKMEPVLIFRQSRQKWRVILNVAIQLPPSVDQIPWQLTRGEITWEAFQDIYEQRIERLLRIQQSQTDHIQNTMIV
jgi:hypothetical protein